jgi:hypothetical protein
MMFCGHYDFSLPGEQHQRHFEKDVEKAHEAFLSVLRIFGTAMTRLGIPFGIGLVEEKIDLSEAQSLDSKIVRTFSVDDEDIPKVQKSICVDGINPGPLDYYQHSLH